MIIETIEEVLGQIMIHPIVMPSAMQLGQIDGGCYEIDLTESLWGSRDIVWDQ